MDTRNPRAVIGDNAPIDTATRVSDALRRDYEQLSQTVEDLLNKARTAPTEVTSDEEALSTGVIVKELRDADRRIEGLRETEKDPYLRSAQAVDSFFFSLRERLMRRVRGGKPGAIDILQGRIDTYLERKRRQEEERRRREAAEALRIAREKAEEEARLAREAEDARLAAERARKPEKIEAKTAVAEAAEAEASAASAEAAIAADRAQEAHIDTLAKPADLTRTRGEGVLLTQARQPFAIITDRDALDKDALWPFITDVALEQALRAWARTTGHTKQMTGAEVGFRARGVTR